VIYQKSPGQGPFPDEPRKSWGPLTRYLEIGDDLYALRHVDVYANGHALRYDRVHWVDDFGILADARYHPKRWEKWWGPSVVIDPSEFEVVWRAAESSPSWPIQVASARMARMGAVPIWLARRRGTT
jgi:hypothetical protein